MTAASYTHDVDVRYRDLDPRRHVNHAVHVSYAEQAKIEFFEASLGVSLADASTVVRSLELDYEAPIEAGETVRIAVEPAAVGTTSYTLAYELTVAGVVVATARTVSVYLDEETGEPRPLPEEWREALSPEG